jgi:myo-inositol-1-phosphate synthase
MIWCGSTEVFHRPAAVHQTLKDFECGLQKNDPEIAPSQIYAYAALKIRRAVRQRRAQSDHRYAGAAGTGARPQRSHCGKDFKTGQTFMKTLIAPGLKSRMLGVAAGSRPTFWAIATAKCWTIRARSSRRKKPSSRCWSRSCSRTVSGAV